MGVNSTVMLVAVRSFSFIVCVAEKINFNKLLSRFVICFEV